MTTIQLCVKQLLQGTFELKELNLFFVFQVNCPGCFMYGFPLANWIYLKYRDSGINVLGIATAFEDFGYNSAENAQLLVRQKKTVGETKKALGEYYSQAIDFPIVVDYLASKSELEYPENLNLLCEAITGFNKLSITEQDEIRQAVKRHLQRTSQTSLTFSLNQLPGTPTFLLVDQNLQLLNGWFGYADEAKVVNLLSSYLAPVNIVK
ncbi:MAG: hypothetical protein KME22_11375 [Hassallia sp. WJT32-NPBG1]|jgi:hypothetical protein|nr:hypothetical protein [Hassallia sp. WJT32-NPBG1]